MTYTIQSAQWGNEDLSSAVVLSKEVGHVAISAADTPEEWVAFLEWSKANPVGSIPSFAPPVPLTSGQKLTKLASSFGMSVNELKAALSAP